MMGYLGQDYYGQYPQAVTQTAPSTTLQSGRLFVDWDGDGTFNGTYDDISALVLRTVTHRGRDYASNLTGQSVAGTLEATLINTDGRFSRFNSSSPLYGKLLPGLKVKLMAYTPISYVIWTGILADIQPSAGGFLTATLQATGVFRLLADQANQITAGPLVGSLTNTVADAILDAAGWPAAQRNIQAGNVPVGDWFVAERVALQALQEIVDETELGFLSEGLAFDVVAEARYNRVLNSGTSQASFSDAAATTVPYLALEQVDPLREVFNRIQAAVQPYETQALAVLWTLNGTPFSLSPGAGVTYIAPVSSGYVSAWTTPVIGTDIVQTGVSNSDIGLTTGEYANFMIIQIANNHASLPCTFTLVQARGIAVTPIDSYNVYSQDATSQASYGRRNYPLPSPWYQNQAYAQAACDYFISLKKDPHPVLRFTIPAVVSTAMFTYAVMLNLSQRITLLATSPLSMLGINQDFFIESISHDWDFGRGYLLTTLEVSPADVQTHYWQLDVDQLDISTKLAY